MTYFIPEGNVAEFKKRMNRLVKRATKLGSKLEYVVTEDFRDVSVEFLNAQHKKETRWVRHYRCEVEGDRPKYAGWNFIGTLEHTDEGNVLRLIPNETAPEHYRDQAPFCEHCKLKRLRKDTYLVRHETGTVTQVGSGCLVDFLGHANPQQIAQLAEVWVNIDELTKMAEDSHWLGGGGGYISREREDLMTFLSIVAEITIREGFWSRSAVERLREKHGDNARLPEVTAWRAASYMHPHNAEMKIEADKYIPSDAAKQLAEDARNWALSTFGHPLPTDGNYDDVKAALLGKARENLSDFEHNLLVVAKGESCERRTFGIAAYLIQAYRKANNLIPERKKVVRVNSEHIGNVADRFKGLEVTCEKVHTWNSEQFGAGYLFKMLTADGNVVVWRTYYPATENIMVEGHRYTVAATVKKHGEYNGEKQTEMSRLKVLTGIVSFQPENLEPDDSFQPTAVAA